MITEEEKADWINNHPLINPESRHYQMIDGKESILLMEDMFSTAELMAWAKITSFKYRFRITSKNLHGDMDKSILSDAKKIQTYENYYLALQAK